MSLWVIVGGQFGSEGKGKTSAFIALQNNIDICIRCGGPNSGHSFLDRNGQTVVLRQLPTGFVNPGTLLLIPAGALIDPLVLRDEIESLSLPSDRIRIDPNCVIIEECDRRAERDLGLRERLSSTLCGVGAAVARRVLRGPDVRTAKDVVNEHPWLGPLIAKESVSAQVNSALDRRQKVLIEGTQGFGLSLYHSGYYPHCTSRDTTASGFLSEVGVSPRMVAEIVLVLRTFPIRVAGEQAGLLEKEITWKDIQSESGYQHDIEERTSVTGKIRRVGRFDWNLAHAAVRVNRPTSIAINGLDYFNFCNFGLQDEASLSKEATDFVINLEKELATPVKYLGVGPGLEHIICRKSGGPALTPKRFSIGSSVSDHVARR